MSLDAAGPLTFDALAKGTIDIATVYATQAALAENDLVVLRDDRNLHPVQNPVPVMRSGVLDSAAQAILSVASSRLTSRALAAMNLAVRNGNTAAQAANDWLLSQGLLLKEPRIQGNIRISSLDFSEAQTLVEIYALLLRTHGMTVAIIAPLGGRDLVVPALERGVRLLSEAWRGIMGSSRTADAVVY